MPTDEEWAKRVAELQRVNDLLTEGVATVGVGYLTVRFKQLVQENESLRARVGTLETIVSGKLEEIREDLQNMKNAGNVLRRRVTRLESFVEPEAKPSQQAVGATA